MLYTILASYLCFSPLCGEEPGYEAINIVIHILLVYRQYILVYSCVVLLIDSAHRTTVGCV